MFAGIPRWTRWPILAGLCIGLVACETPQPTTNVKPYPGQKPTPGPAPLPAPPPPVPVPPKTDSVVNGNLWNAAMENRRLSLERVTAGTSIVVSQTPDNELKLLIPSDLAFAPHSVTIGPALRPVLDVLAGNLTGQLEIQLSISAHTDSTGSDPQNNTLSLERARSVRDYLVNKQVVTPFIQVAGRGSRDPVATNDTAAGRTRNRRMEIVVRQAAR